MYNYKNFSTLFVSQKFGSDGANGLSARADECGNAPLLTLESAVSLVKRLRAEGVERPLTIAITDDYYTDKPIEIRGVDKLTIESFGGRKRIIGGTRIEGFGKDTFNGVACLSAPVSEEIAERGFTDFFVNGNRARVTRFPSTGELYLVDTDCAYSKDNPPPFLYGHSKWFKVRKEDLAGLSGIENATINYMHYWIDEHSPIESYDPESGILTMKYLSRFTSSAMYEEHESSSVKYYLTNLPNTFLNAGEWYLDRSAARVYYIPNEDETLADIEAFAPLTDKLFEIEGDDIRLRDLELTVTRCDYASTNVWHSDPPSADGEILTFGGDIQSVCWAPGAISVSYSKRFTIEGCYLHGVGPHGILLGNGVTRARIENNEISDIAAGGIKISGGKAGSDEKDISGDCIIRKNHIHDCGVRYFAGCGVLIMDASNNEISDNEIHDLKYSGISVGWVWGYADSSTYGNVIRRNHIHHIGSDELSDMGGIYLLGKQQGTVVSENRIHDVCCLFYGAWGIYLDEGSSFITVENNVVYRTKTSSFHMHYGSHNVVRNNIFFGEGSSNIRPTREEDHERLVFENNILITDGLPVYSPHAKAEGGIGAGRNVIYMKDNTEGVILRNKDGVVYTVSEWCEKLGRDEGSVFEDPKIPSLAEYDFTLAPDSPAIALGFKPLPENVAKPKICK
jgi:parallel beta-helix repeat protein